MMWYEPTDIDKATKIFQAGPQWQQSLHFISPNKNELLVIAQFFDIKVPESTSLEEIKEITEQLAQHIPIIISTLGAQGVLIARRGSANEPFYDEKGQLINSTSIESHMYLPLLRFIEHSEEKLNVNGCGDCLNAGIICGIYKDHLTLYPLLCPHFVMLWINFVNDFLSKAELHRRSHIHSSTQLKNMKKDEEQKLHAWQTLIKDYKG
ncbi:hypothetical protein KM043_018187 [Ampulex compressa]|nr:hypothetical protein KM043_018187 [Ampulex compressa]